MAFWILLFIIVAALAYVRFAPSEPGRWHQPSRFDGLGEKRLKGGYIWREDVTGDGTAALEALDSIIRQDPRSRHLAGSPQEGQTTYVTRSRVFGFPDYTTIGIYDGPDGSVDTQVLEIFARLRFGGSDLGVNRHRVQGWLAQFER